MQVPISVLISTRLLFFLPFKDTSEMYSTKQLFRDVSTNTDANRWRLPHQSLFCPHILIVRWSLSIKELIGIYSTKQLFWHSPTNTVTNNNRWRLLHQSPAARHSSQPMKCILRYSMKILRNVFYETAVVNQQVEAAPPAARHPPHDPDFNSKSKWSKKFSTSKTK